MKTTLQTRSLWLLVCLLCAQAPAHAGLFDALEGLHKKVVAGSNKADQEVDLAYEAEMAKKFPPYAFAGDAADQAPGYVELVRGANFKGIKKIGIVNFSVEFALFKEVTARGGSGWKGGTTRVKTKSMQIPQPDVAQLQAMVDRLYAQTVKDFAALGIEVLPFEVLKTTPSYAELAPAQHASPWVTDTKDTQSVFMAPTGMLLYMDNPKRADVMKGLGFIFGTNTRLKEIMMTHELKQEVHLLSVNMVVDFAALKGSGSNFLSYASVTGANMHHLHPNNTFYRFIGPTQPLLLLVNLKQPLVSDKPLQAEVNTETRRRSAQTFSNIDLTVTTEQADSAVRDAEVFDLEVYYQRSEDMLQAARQMFFIELGKAR